MKYKVTFVFRFTWFVDAMAALGWLQKNIPFQGSAPAATLISMTIEEEKSQQI